MAEDTDTKARRQPTVPEGYTSSDDFLHEMRERFDRAVGADQHNRAAGAEDIDFVIGNQWDATVKARRVRAKKPVLTINRLPAFLAQIINNQLLNETEIRVLPDKDSKQEVAEIRQGVIRSIFKNSEADFARDEASKYQIACGVGAFQMCLEYTSDDVFDQDIKIKPIVDPFAAVWDELSVEPSGGDANYSFVVDDLPMGVFKMRFPWAAVADFSSGFNNYGGATQWYQDNSVKIVSYWRMIEDGMKTLVLMADGTIKEMAGMAEAETGALAGLVQRRPDGSVYARQMPRRVAQMYLCSGADILEGPYTLPVSSIPVYRVPGWEFRLGMKVYRWGLIRFLKDPMRLHNYWRSTIAEQLVAAPRNKWTATKDAISGYEKEWRNSHLSDDPLLVYNAEGSKPERVPVPPADPALLEQAATSVQDIRDVSNIHEAALGIKSNEVSGKALQQRQMATDLGTFIYRDRARMADERLAKNINELFPTVYDTQRIVRTIGDDDKELQVVINDPMNPLSDVTAGKYDVSVTIGPSTITKRQLASEQMTAFVNAVPESAAMVMDLIAEKQDWPGAKEFARRFRLSLPPGVIPQDEIPPEMQAMQQQAQQKQQVVEQIELAKAQAEIDGMVAEAEESRARAEQLRASAAAEMSNAEARTADVTGKNLERDFDARLRVVETSLAAEANNEEKTSDGE